MRPLVSWCALAFDALRMEWRLQWRSLRFRVGAALYLLLCSAPPIALALLIQPQSPHDFGSNQLLHCTFKQGVPHGVELPRVPRNQQFAAFPDIAAKQPDFSFGENGGIGEAHDRKLFQAFHGNVFVQDNAKL